MGNGKIEGLVPFLRLEHADQGIYLALFELRSHFFPGTVPSPQRVLV